jgi:glycine/D-amino acid oxidase-like deaminating enzyme
VEVAVTPVRQHLFRLELEEGLPSPIPMIFDPDGTHWRLDDARSPGAPDRLVIGRSRAAEPPGENFVCDESRLDDLLQTLQRRYPVARVRSVAEAWAGLAIAELIAGASPTFDISPLAVDRFERGELFLDGALI